MVGVVLYDPEGNILVGVKNGKMKAPKSKTSPPTLESILSDIRDLIGINTESIEAYHTSVTTAPNGEQVWLIKITEVPISLTRQIENDKRYDAIRVVHVTEYGSTPKDLSLPRVL